MEKFLGVLFCGGRGVRLGEITRFISKSFVPIFDRPVFQYGLQLLENSQFINEIVILTNNDNDDHFNALGYKTIIQDDSLVFDMFSGWEYIKKVTGTAKHGVLMPSDNISDIAVDRLISLFDKRKVDLVFSLYQVLEKEKLAQMGCYDPQAKKFFYKHPNPPVPFGVLAPYIVRNTLRTNTGDNVLDHPNSAYAEHNGFWFDIGDSKSIVEASVFMMNRDV